MAAAITRAPAPGKMARKAAERPGFCDGEYILDEFPSAQAQSVAEGQ